MCASAHRCSVVLGESHGERRDRVAALIPVHARAGAASL